MLNKSKLIIGICLSIIFVLAFQNIYLNNRFNGYEEYVLTYNNEEMDVWFKDSKKECNYENNEIVGSHQNIEFFNYKDFTGVKDVEMYKTTDSDSMEPTIFSNNVVFSKKYNNENLNIGDIIIYEDNNMEKIVHRIIGFDGNNIITKGDNNEFSDFKITKEDVRGVVQCTCYN